MEEKQEKLLASAAIVCAVVCSERRKEKKKIPQNVDMALIGTNGRTCQRGTLSLYKTPPVTHPFPQSKKNNLLRLLRVPTMFTINLVCCFLFAAGEDEQIGC